MKIVDYLTEDDTRIGKTILSQIKALDKWALDSWGAKNIVLFPQGIQFDIKESKVIITLDKSVYNIEFNKKTFCNVLAENIVSTLDGVIK